MQGGTCLEFGSISSLMKTCKHSQAWTYLRCLPRIKGPKSDNAPPLLETLQWFLISLNKSKLSAQAHTDPQSPLQPLPSPLTSSQVTFLLANLSSSPFSSLNAPSSFVLQDLTLVSPVIGYTCHLVASYSSVVSKNVLIHTPSLLLHSFMHSTCHYLTFFSFIYLYVSTH